MLRLNRFIPLIIHRTTIPELIELAPSLLRGEEISRFSFFLQQVFDLKQSAENKEMYVREGVDSSLDEYRAIQQNMLNILDERVSEWLALVSLTLDDVRNALNAAGENDVQ